MTDRCLGKLVYCDVNHLYENTDTSLLTVPIISFGQSKIESWLPEIKSDQIHTYKKTDGMDLNLWVLTHPNTTLAPESLQ